MILDNHHGQGHEQQNEQGPQAARDSGEIAAAPVRLNPPPGWPPVPPGWAPPPGWQPDPSWPDPPPGWNLWIKDTTARDWQLRAAGCVIAGGAAVFLGSLLPFVSPPQPDFYVISSAPKDTAAFFGIVLILLGGVMRARSRRAHVISGIIAFAVAGFTELILAGFIAAGLLGVDQTDDLFGTVHVTWSPQAGIIICALGCAAAGIGGILSFRPADKQTPGHRPRAAR